MTLRLPETEAEALEKIKSNLGLNATKAIRQLITSHAHTQDQLVRVTREKERNQCELDEIKEAMRQKNKAEKKLKKLME